MWEYQHDDIILIVFFSIYNLKISDLYYSLNLIVIK